MTAAEPPIDKEERRSLRPAWIPAFRTELVHGLKPHGEAHLCCGARWFYRNVSRSSTPPLYAKYGRTPAGSAASKMLSAFPIAV